MQTRHSSWPSAASSRSPVRIAERGVAGERDERAQPPLARSVDLLGEAGERQLAEHLGQTAHAAVPTPRRDARAAARLPDERRPAGSGGREHDAAGPVEVPGQHVQHVDEPARRRAECLQRRPDPAVDRRALRGGELPREPADLRRLDPTGPSDPLRRERLDEALHLGEARDVRLEAPQADELLVEEGVRHRGKQQRVRPGPDEVVLVRLSRGSRPHRVDDDHLPAARPDRPQPAAHVGSRDEAAVRDDGVGSEDEEMRRAIDIGDPDRELRAVEQSAREGLRLLVDRADRVERSRAEHLVEAAKVEAAREAVPHRVADVRADRVGAVGLEDRDEQALHLGERLVPAHRLVRAVRPAHVRLPEPVRVVVQVTDARALGTDVALAEDVCCVPSDPFDAGRPNRHLEAARRLAERAGPVRKPVSLTVSILIPSGGRCRAPRGRMCRP